jgi:16S rRNA (uracil1498-N3)-methyltransferase
VPEVEVPGSLATALGAAPRGFARLLLHSGGEPMGAVRRGQGFLAVVGPEGGLTAGEVDACVGAGCRLVGLGPRTLRAETAAIAAAALLQHAAGDL